jgi:hypothetical protein
MPILLESDFLTIDLNTIFKARNTKTDAASTEEPTVAEQRDLKSITDWGKELEARLVANKKLGSEARESEYEIEAKFFKDYFETNWEPACAKQLLSIGEPLKKALKVLGFDKAKNPILAFISDTFVKNQLIKTKLLNSSTFKAIYNAVAKKQVALSQLAKANDYNIIYCLDFYKKSLEEMSKYLNLQAKVLSTASGAYSEEVKDRNKTVFAYDKAITEKDIKERAKIVIEKEPVDTADGNYQLNSIAQVMEILEAFNIDSKEDTEDTSEKKAESEKVEVDFKAIDKAKLSPEEVLAAVQYVMIANGNESARKALTDTRFNSVSVKADTVSKIAKILPKGRLDKASADKLVNLLVKKL